jgi:hypothetical protein
LVRGERISQSLHDHRGHALREFINANEADFIRLVRWPRYSRHGVTLELHHQNPALPVDAREPLDRDPHASFFGDFSDDRLPRRLAILDPPPGISQRSRSRRWQTKTSPVSFNTVAKAPTRATAEEYSCGRRPFLAADGSHLVRALDPVQPGGCG